jgi:hypothetical protein
MPQKAERFNGTVYRRANLSVRFPPSLTAWLIKTPIAKTAWTTALREG